MQTPRWAAARGVRGNGSRRKAVAPAALLGLALLAGCGGCGEPAPSAPTTAASQTSASAASGAPTRANATEITVTMADGKVETPSKRVKVARGARVRITATSDRADEFHLHGYDREVELVPGRPAVLEFTAGTTGVFEAEFHTSGTRAFELQVG